MFKKSLFMLVALAIVATTVMIPMASSAADISGDLFFNVDFQDGSLEDQTGTFNFEEDSSMVTDGDDAEFFIEEDATLNRKVGVFDGWGALVYSSDTAGNLKGYDLTNGMTMEAYVYIDYSSKIKNTLFMEAAFSSMHLQQYNDGNDAMVGFRCGDSLKTGESGEAGDSGYQMRNAYTENGTILETQKWVHLVGTSNGSVNRFYIDGELVAEVERASSTLKIVNDKDSTEVYIGDSVFGGMYDCVMEGKIAFARMYKAYADDDTAEALYKATVGGGSTDDPTTDDPTDTPTNTPSDDASATPSNTPSDNPTSAPTNSPNNGSSNNSGSTSNTQTFDLGIVSLAAVALSSAVAIKKRK